MHGTVSVATLWARVHSLEFDRPRVDPTHHNFCFSTNAHAGVSQACESICVWGTPVPYQGSAPIPQTPLSTRNETTSNQQAWLLASFPGFQSPNAVEGLVKFLRRMTSGRCWEVWLTCRAYIMACTAIYRKCLTSFSVGVLPGHHRIGDRRPGNEATWLHKKGQNYLEQELVWQASSIRFCMLCSFVQVDYRGLTSCCSIWGEINIRTCKSAEERATRVRACNSNRSP